jgi:hypothetical protein
VEEEQQKYQAFMKRKAEFEVEEPEKVRAALPLESYAGTYNDAWYGDVKISYEQDKLRINFTHTPMLQGTLEHYNDDTFIVRWDEPLLEADAFIDFSVNRNNEVHSATLEAVAPYTDFSFDFHNLNLKKQKQETGD